MKLHANAALSLNKRRVLARRVVSEGWSLTKAAEAAEVSDQTAAKWANRYRAGGELGLHDRSSAPLRVHNRTDERRIQLICQLRRLRMTGAEIAEVLGMPETTVSGILNRSGLGRLGRLGLEPPGAMSARVQASFCTSTSRSWVGSRREERAIAPSAGQRVAVPASSSVKAAA